MKGLRLWLRGKQAALSYPWWKPCKVSEHRQSMEPQLSRTDIHMEEMTKRQLSAGTRFGMDLSENTPPPGDCPTVALWRGMAAQHCFTALNKWTRVWVGILGQRPTQNENTLLCRKTIRTHSRNKHPSKRGRQLLSQIKQTWPSC